MKELKEKIAYLEGLSEGLDAKAGSREGRLLSGIIDVLGDLAETIEEVEDAQDNLEEYVESIDEDLYDLEDEIYEDVVDPDELQHYVDVECPNCKEMVCFDPEILNDDDLVEVTCPSCDEVVFINDEEHIEELAHIGRAADVDI